METAGCRCDPQDLSLKERRAKTEAEITAEITSEITSEITAGVFVFCLKKGKLREENLLGLRKKESGETE